MSDTDRISRFLAQPSFAVVGASTDRSKYGNKVLRCYQQHGRAVTPVNPRADEVEGLPAFADLASIPETPAAVSVITPPSVTSSVLDEAARLGIAHVWLQPGAEDAAVLAHAAELGLDVIAGGPCLLVALGFRDV